MSMQKLKTMFVGSSKPLKIVTLYNLLCVVVGAVVTAVFLPLYSAKHLTEYWFIGFLSLAVFSTLLFCMNYFLLKGSRLAFYAMFLWYMIQIVVLKGVYEFHFTLHFTFFLNNFGINILAAAMTVILLFGKKDLKGGL